MSNNKLAQKLNLDLNVCFNNWWNLGLSANLDVGRVINMFAIFATALVDARRWKAGDEEAGNRAVQIMTTAFPGNHDQETYLPLPCGVEEDGNVHHYVTNSVVRDQFDMMANMKLTPESIMVACFDLQAISRMYGEQTIDSAKSGMEVIIENLKQLKSMKSASKLELKVKIDWDNDKVKLTQHKPEDETKVVINDIFNQLRMEGIKEVAQLADMLAKVDQSFSEKTTAWIEQIASDPEYAGYISLIRLVKQMYMSVSQVKNNCISSLAKACSDREILEQYKKAIKPVYDMAYDGLRNMLRTALAPISSYRKIALCLYVTMEDKKAKTGCKGSSSNLSKFTQDLLDKEFFLFICQLYKGDESVPKYTEDALEKCIGYEDGDVAEFVFGEADDENGRAVAVDPTLDGQYIIRKNENGRMVASRKIADLVEVPEGDASKLTFITKIASKNGVSKDLDSVIKPGVEVQLVPFNKQYGLHDAVLVDGEEVFKFRCDEGEKRGNSAFISKHYGNAVGVVSSAIVGVVNLPQDNGKIITCKVAVVTLKDVRREAVIKYTGQAKPAAKTAVKKTRVSTGVGAGKAAAPVAKVRPTTGVTEAAAKPVKKVRVSTGITEAADVAADAVL